MATNKTSISRRQFLMLLGSATLAVFQQELFKNRVIHAQTGKTVLIIGAGIAGLAAGRSLLDAGFDVIILEGRDRIGGRIWTNRSMRGIPLEMGAQWIQGLHSNPVTDLVEAYGIETLPSDEENIALYTADGEAVDEATMEEYDEYFSEFMYEVSLYVAILPEDISLGEAIGVVLEAWDLSEEETQILLTLISTNIELEFAADIDDLSAWWWDSGSGFRGGDAIFPNGYDQLINSLSQGLDIRLNELVETIEYAANAVRVHSANQSFEGAYAIVTLPLGVLKSGSVRFDPELPSTKLASIHNLGMNVLNKVYLHFPEVFWDSASEWLGYLGDGGGEWAAGVNIYAYLEEPILLLLNAGEYGLAIEDLSDEQIIQSAMAMLHRIYGENIPEPDDVLITRWGKDTFTFGSYSSMYLGASPDDRRALADSVQNLLFFAGEATSLDYAATVHGALLSGRRAAQEIIENS